MHPSKNTWPHLLNTLSTTSSIGFLTIRSNPNNLAITMMLFKFISVLLAIVTATTARAVSLNVTSLNMTSKCNRTLHERTLFSMLNGIPMPNTEKDLEDPGRKNTYTAQRMDQFREGHMDALMMCRKVIEASTYQTDTFDRIFSHYFSSVDRQLVLGQSALQHYSAPDH